MVSRLVAWTAVFRFLFLTSGILLFLSGSILANGIYDELIQMNVGCGALDSCHGNRISEDLRVVNCQCGPRCSLLGTCCADADQPTDDGRGVPAVPTRVFGSNETVFMVSDCGRNGLEEEDNDSIRDLCEFEDFSDLFLLAPVSNTRTGTVYRNYYCFVCNEKEDENGPMLWNLHLTADSLSEPAPPGGSFPELRHQWGLFYLNDDLAWPSFEPPPEIQSGVDWYRENVIDTCPDDWTDRETERKCGSYTGMVYVRNRNERYRNAHCAICNGREPSELSCEEPEGYTADNADRGSVFVGSFPLRDELGRCPGSNQVFDRFADRCRTVRCGRGQKMVDGDCEGGDATNSIMTSASPRDVFQWVTKRPPTTAGSTFELPNRLTTRTDDFNWISNPMTTPGARLPSTPPSSPQTDEPEEPDSSIVLEPQTHPDDFRWVTDPPVVSDIPEGPRTTASRQTTSLPTTTSVRTDEPEDPKPTTTDPVLFTNGEIPESSSTTVGPRPSVNGPKPSTGRYRPKPSILRLSLTIINHKPRSKGSLLLLLLDK